MGDPSPSKKQRVVLTIDGEGWDDRYYEEETIDDESDDGGVKEVGPPPPSSRQEAGPSTGPGAGALPGDGDDDDECQFVSSSGSVACADFPHARYVCLNSPRIFSDQSDAEAARRCPQCFCYVCDEPASSCAHWETHCFADECTPVWKALRTYHRDYAKMPIALHDAKATAPTIAPSALSFLFDSVTQAKLVRLKATLAPPNKRVAMRHANALISSTGGRGREMLVSLCLMIDVDPRRVLVTASPGETPLCSFALAFQATFQLQKGGGREVRTRLEAELRGPRSLPPAPAPPEQSVVAAAAATVAAAAAAVAAAGAATAAAASSAAASASASSAPGPAGPLRVAPAAEAPATAAEAPATANEAPATANEAPSQAVRRVYTQTIHDLAGLNDAVYFREPVDWKALQLNDYRTVIASPMDLGTCAQKLEACVYPTAADLRRDVDLIFANAIAYNGPSSWIIKYVRRMQGAVCARFDATEASLAKYRLRCGPHAVSPALFVDETLPVAEAWLVLNPGPWAQAETAAPWFGRAGEAGARATLLLPVSLLARAHPLYVHVRRLGKGVGAAHARWYRVDTSLYHHTGARYGDLAKAACVEGADIAQSAGGTSPVCEVVLRVPVTESSITHVAVDWTTDANDGDVRRVMRVPRKRAPGAAGLERVRSTQWDGNAVWVSVKSRPGGPPQRKDHWHLDTTGLFR